MKYLILSVLTLVVLSSVLLPNLSTQALAQVNSSFLTYTNTDLGFTMKYPSDWTIDEKNVSSFTVRFISPDIYKDGIASVHTFETGKTIEGVANSLSSNESLDEAHGVKLIEVDKNGYFLSGHPALRIIYSQRFVTEPHDLKFMGFVAILGGKEYMIMYAAPPESFPNQLQTAQTMIDSFQIISKQ
jgi:photosystem II reaction center protein PsbP